ncbi:MAG: hypothetical protein AB7H48_07675 [Parachlamydiales bacterium]
MQGKLANIITEIAKGSTIPDAQLKGIVSGEKVTAEHKHMAPFYTCWFGTNHMPYSVEQLSSFLTENLKTLVETSI